VEAKLARPKGRRIAEDGQGGGGGGGGKDPAELQGPTKKIFVGGLSHNTTAGRGYWRSEVRCCLVESHAQS
jgi:hypothetical protein